MRRAKSDGLPRTPSTPCRTRIGPTTPSSRGRTRSGRRRPPCTQCCRPAIDEKGRESPLAQTCSARTTSAGHGVTLAPPKL